MYSRSEFLFPDGIIGKNSIYFGGDMSSSVNIDNVNKNILILIEERTQRLSDTTLIAEAKYPTNFIKWERRFVLSLDHNGSESFLFADTKKVHQFNVDNSEIKPYPFCLGNNSKDFTINNMKQQQQQQKNRINRMRKLFFCWL